MADVDAGLGKRPVVAGPESADARGRARMRRQVNPLGGLLHDSSTAFRRRMIASSLVAVLLLGGISLVLALRQYDDAKSRALTDLQARVLAVAGIVQSAFAGDIAVLETAARAPVVADARIPAMSAYLRGVRATGGASFSAGIAWIDRQAHLRASGAPLAPGAGALDLSGRTYFRQVVASGKPYVSAGLVGRLSKKSVIVVAVPTRDAHGRLDGVLTGSILVGSLQESARALALGYGGLDVIDRDGRMLLSKLTLVENTALLTRMRRASSGVFSATHGLDGRGDDAIAFGAASIPGWLVVIDQPHSTLFAAAQHSLDLELASVGASLLLIFVILFFVARRARRDGETQDSQARSWSRLTRALNSASTPAEVAEALLGSLADAFPGAVAIVAFASGEGVQVKASSRPRFARWLLQDSATLGVIAEFGRERMRSAQLEREPSLAPIHTRSGRRLRSLHALPVSDRRTLLGTISLVSPASELSTSEWALLESFADQASGALRRARIFEHEHELAVRLQRSLLPTRLPAAEGVELAGHYHAGGPGVEVGGDWYDAVARPDGIIQLSVGDVSGRGIGAATVMSRQRHSFHAYAYECVSPAEIIRRMLRHVYDDEMVTVACLSLDALTGELAYSCAGHPPPLLLDHNSGEVLRLDGAGAPPLGVAEPGEIVEARLRLSGAATLALYTDGLIERRGENLDRAIDFLAGVLAQAKQPTPNGILDQIAAELGPPVDDVALLLAGFDPARAPFALELPATPTSLPGIRRRLRVWLARHELDTDESAEIVLAVSEACNNAIEHAYPGGEGTLRVRIDSEQETLRVVVEDSGTWRAERPSDERGRGILLMETLMSSAEIETGPSGTKVSLARRIRQGRAPQPSASSPRS